MYDPKNNDAMGFTPEHAVKVIPLATSTTFPESVRCVNTHQMSQVRAHKDAILALCKEYRLPRGGGDVSPRAVVTPSGVDVRESDERRA